MNEREHAAIANGKAIAVALEQGIPFSYLPWHRTFNFYAAMLK